jgi:hypothetical protein
MALMKVANSTALSWVDVQKLSFNTANYEPVMALAQNHVHFLDVPGVAAGSAMIFVIHCMPHSFHWPVPVDLIIPIQFRTCNHSLNYMAISQLLMDKRRHSLKTLE